MEPRGDRLAFGHPGTALFGAPSRKDGFGTAYSADSQLWYTMWRGVVTEVYYPTIDRPKLRGIEYVVTDGETFLHDEAVHMESTIERPHEHALGYRVQSRDPEGRYTIDKEVLSAPHLPCLLMRTRMQTRTATLRERLKLYVLIASRLDPNDAGDDGDVFDLVGMPILAASRPGVALAVGGTVPFSRASVGYVGRSDARTDLMDHFGMSWEFDHAPAGHILLAGEIPVPDDGEFTLAFAFGGSPEAASTTLLQALGTPFSWQRDRFIEQWDRTARHERPLGSHSGDDGRLYRASHSVLLAHEDKEFPGAFIASPSTPWGIVHGGERGGYHLVWTRDLVHTATGLLAAGNREAPLRALIYLASRQQGDGGFPQNFWVDGGAYWKGVQLDEVAQPILLAARLDRARALQQFDPYPLVLRAARYLIERGPATPEDRWEEVSGYSPSTLAAQIAALTCAAGFARARGHAGTSRFIQEYADFLECHVDPWTITEHGTLDPEIPRHYVRIRPIDPNDPAPNESADFGTIRLPNLPPGTTSTFPTVEIVSGDFLELVREGIRAADDPAVVDSLRLIDRVLRVDTPRGPVWKRYTHDGYGEGMDGSPFLGSGVGRAWPLLTGERGLYELAAGHDPAPYLRALEHFATGTGLLPEQVWDAPALPDRELAPGHPTGSATPLAWAHAEYVTLLRSVADGAIFDRIPMVADRYLHRRRPTKSVEIWKFNRRPPTIGCGRLFRIQVSAPFRLHWSDDDWRTAHDTDSTETSLGISYVDLPPLERPGNSYRFTFYWPQGDRWEGRDFRIDSAPASPAPTTP